MKQIGGLLYPLVKTIDDLVFYELCGEYYARKKSSLSSDRVKTSPEFRRTMVHAHLLVRASKIGAQVYKALPPGWRQFWMYRSFTGEAFIFLQDNPYDDEEVKQLLWKCYVEYWEQRRVIDPDNPIFQPKPKKIRKRRKYSEESIKRLLKRKDKHGRPRYRDLEEEERRRQHKAMNRACYERTMEKQRRLAEEEKLRATSFELRASAVTEQVLEQEDKAIPALPVQRAKGPGIVMRGCKPRIAVPHRASNNVRSVVRRITGGRIRSVRKFRRSRYFVAEAALFYPVFSG
jgi:hypothetical protein